MAYSEYLTRLSLDRFAQIVGIPLWHFNQLILPNSLQPDGPVTIGCNQLILQHRYQSPGGNPGRNDIAREIANAERRIETALHFDVMKTWNTEEIPPGHFGRPVKLDRSYYIEPAVRATTLIADDVSYSTEDLDGDGYEETAIVESTLTAEMAAAIADPEEVRLFYPGKNGDPHWEIRPITVEIDGTSLRITLSLSQLVDPAVVEQMIPGPLNPDDSPFIDGVDLYRVYSDTDITHAVILRCKQCDGTYTLLSSERFSVYAPDKVGSVVRMGTPISSVSFTGALCGCWHPVETFSYSAGWPKSTYTKVDSYLEEAIVSLVMAEIGDICPCTTTIGKWKDYSKDLALISHSEASGGGVGMHDRWAPRPGVLRNPWGTLLGHDAAWALIVDHIVGETMNDYVEPRMTPMGLSFRDSYRLW